MKLTSQIVTNVLLAAILTVLVLIWQRMPPTLGDFLALKSNKEAHIALQAKQPVVRAVIPDTLGVDVINRSLDVHIQNTPIEVRVEK